jgi:putative aminopeptidase
MNRQIWAASVLAAFLLCGLRSAAQEPAHATGDEHVEASASPASERVGWIPELDGTLRWAPRQSAVAGYETGLLSELKSDLKNYSTRTDSLGNLIVTFGSGSPVRLIATPVDEPGYVVSAITQDGYLRVQRLPQSAPNPVFDALHFAQPVAITTRDGKAMSGVFAGLSVHLQPGRINGPKMNHPDELYVDIGAKSADEVRAAGIDVLDPIVLASRPFQADRWPLGFEAGKAVGDRFGMAALLELLPQIKLSKSIEKQGTTIVAFVTQSWTGGRGLNRLLEEVHADEMVYIGRMPVSVMTPSEVKSPVLGEGVLLGAGDSKAPAVGLAARFQGIAKERDIALKVVTAPKPRIAGYAKPSEFPEQFVQLATATLWPATPAEVVSYNDVLHLEQLLQGYLHIYAPPNRGIPAGGPYHNPTAPVTFADIVMAYGASGHEAGVKGVILQALPEWARKRATTDAAGNLVLHVGDGKRDEKTPRIAFVAHMDEIGYDVKKIEDDGRLQVDVLGGGYLQFFLGHVVLVHVKAGSPVGGVLELPAGWDKPGFEWPSGTRSMDEGAYVYVGTRTKEETEKLGIAVGDSVTIPKEYRPLQGTRANARSFDDRVGCAALLAAVSALGPELPGRDVTFVWSKEEEIGLKGAAAFAEQAAKDGRVPDFVFAIDTFVSSDSPLETKRFADAELGKGFVVRAVDNSNVVPLQYVDRVVALAKGNNIAVQYGVTGGGNDGAVFTRFGSMDVAMGWPLRYAHSPAEVIDLKDLEALGKIVEVIARKW